MEVMEETSCDLLRLPVVVEHVEQCDDIDVEDIISILDSGTDDSDEDNIDMDMCFAECNEEDELESISCWIEKSFGSSVSSVATSEDREVKRRRTHKINLWKTSWGYLLRSRNTRNVGSFEEKKFRFIFRVSCRMFDEELLPLCRTIFDVDWRSYIPLEFRILISLRLLSTDNMSLNVPELSSITKRTVNLIFEDFIKNFSLSQKYRIQQIAQLNKCQDISETYSRIGFPGCCGSIDVVDFRWGVVGSQKLSMEVVVDRNGSVVYASKLYCKIAEERESKEILSELLQGVNYTLYNKLGVPVACRGGYLLVKNEDTKIQLFICPTVENTDDELKKCWSHVAYKIHEDVDEVFNSMKARWRVILSRHFCSFDRRLVQDVIYSCCILNNMSVFYDELDDVNWADISPNIDDDDIYLRNIYQKAIDDTIHDVIILKDSNIIREYRSKYLSHYNKLKSDLVVSFGHQFMYNMICWPRVGFGEWKMRQVVKIKLQKDKYVPLYVKESTMKYGVEDGNGSLSYVGDCGKGLFCTRLIKKGEHIATFKGLFQKLTPLQVKVMSKRNSYLLNYKKGNYLNCKKKRQEKECLASYANTARNAWDTVRNRLAKNNSDICTNYTDKIISLVAIDNIEPNREILVPYGVSHKCGVQIED